MIGHCANNECAKPLHYLRDGRIFVFEMPDVSVETMNGRPANRLSYHWLCGDCAKAFTLRQNLVYGVELCSIKSGESHVTAPGDSTKVASWEV